MLEARVSRVVLACLLLGVVVAWSGSPPAEAQGGLALDLELVADGFVSPVVLTSPPDPTGRRFIVDQVGVIYILTPDGTLLDEPFLDLRPRFFPLGLETDWLQWRDVFDERGLLGLAFHPNFHENGRFYVYYSTPLREGAPRDWDHTARISEFKVSIDDPNVADLDTERIILEIDEPQFNHNAGDLAFGPDGYLYIPLGDGGAAGDYEIGHVAMGNAQDTTSLLGSILRIDVDRGWPGYAIPPDNPFVNGPGRPEVWAWGFRNPFRISFDTVPPHHLFVADAGQDRWEEVSLVSRPGNYGWPIKEGTHWFDPLDVSWTSERGPVFGGDGQPLIDPVVEYPNVADHFPGVAEGGVGTVIVGAQMYRGRAIPELYGKLVVADWSRSWARPAGVLLVAHPRPGWSERWRQEGIVGEWGGPWAYEEVMELDDFILSLGRDADGELYVLTKTEMGPRGETGKVYKIVPRR